MPMELERGLLSTFPSIDETAGETFSHRSPPNRRRALQDSSGNIQPSTLDSQGLDSIKTEDASDSIKEENPSDLNVVRRPRKNARAALKARDEQQKTRRATTRNVVGPDGQFDLATYNKYREKVAKNSKDGGETVWPDELEQAFLEGHEIVGPIGRQKKFIDGKLRGRFQLIGAYIRRKTGVKLKRKQISSHNQVLKGYFGDIKSFRFLLRRRGPYDDPNENDLDSPDSLEMLLAGMLPRKYHPDFLAYREMKRQKRQHAQQEDSDRLINSFPRVFPLDFYMKLQETAMAHSSSKVMHTYTSLTGSPLLEPTALEDLADWRYIFPRLASLQDSRAVDCEITLMEVTLNMNAPATPLEGCLLAMQFELLANPTYAGHTWHCLTNIYCSGNPVHSFQCPVPQDDAGHRDGHVKLKPRFASKYWADRFGGFWRERFSGSRGFAEERERLYFGQMSAVQELYATEIPYSDEPGSEPRSKLVAIYLWRFGTTEPGDTEGRTTWKNLYPPAPKVLPNSPAPSPPPSPHISPDSPIPTHPHAVLLQGTLGLWDEQYGSVETPVDHESGLGFDQDQDRRELLEPTMSPEPEPVMPPDTAIATYHYPAIVDPGTSQENHHHNHNLAFNFPLIPPETFDETASLSAFLDTYAETTAETTAAATYGSTTPPPQDDGPYHDDAAAAAASYWPRCLQSQSGSVLVQGFVPSATSFTDQLQDVVTETVNEDFGLVFE
ncbi:MAG: Transcriptional enhancer factor TEF-1 [Peltula sp. TS41687]|nr:MAG: Transcriptional enhancer factor TEF-1 [Peltula sp. TS41687]